MYIEWVVKSPRLFNANLEDIHQTVQMSNEVDLSLKTIFLIAARITIKHSFCNPAKETANNPKKGPPLEI